LQFDSDLVKSGNSQNRSAPFSGR